MKRRKKASIKPEEFFKLVAVNSGVTDLGVVRDIFYGLVRTISKELTAKHIIKLPDWGEFVLRIHKSRNFMSVTGEMGILPPKAIVKFVPDHKVKKFFYSLGS